MTKKEINEIEGLIREADSENNPDLYNKIYDRLIEIKQKYSDDYLVEYYIGLTCYLNSDTESFRVKMAIKHFEKSILLKKDNIMTTAYLGYCHFDLNEFGKALSYFKEVLSKQDSLKFFIRNHQEWRFTNMAELASLCNLRLKRFSKFKEYYLTWKELYYMYVKNDDFYFPSDLIIETASYLKEKGESMSDENITFFRTVSLDLIGLIKGGDGFEEIYKEELKDLRNWNGHSQFSHYKVYST